MTCRDCGKVMSEQQVKTYREIFCFEVQKGPEGQDEGICNRCISARFAEGDDADDLMAEFSG